MANKNVSLFHFGEELAEVKLVVEIVDDRPWLEVITLKLVESISSK
jgi:hypothetical protein